MAGDDGGGREPRERRPRAELERLIAGAVRVHLPAATGRERRVGR